MTRSYNSRRGTYKRCKDSECSICHKSNDKIRRAKEWKRDFLKFDGILYTYKKTGKRHDCTPYILSTWHYDCCVVPAKESYRTWSWLKGKPNEKGLIVSQDGVIRRYKKLR